MWNKLLFVACISISSLAIGQDRFQFAAFGGFGGSQVSGDHLAGYSKVAFTFGGQISSQLSKSSSLGFRLGFATRGSVKPANEKKGDFTTYKIAMNIVDIPVFYRFHFKNLYAMAGVSTEVIVSFKEETHAGPVVDNRPVKKAAISGLFGVGINFGKRYFVELNGGHGLTYFRKFQANVPFTTRYGNGQYNDFLLFVLGCKLGDFK